MEKILFLLRFLLMTKKIGILTKAIGLAAITWNANASNLELLKDIELGHESECKPVRMDLPPGVMSKIPIHDQSGVDNCWAYTSVALLDAWRLKNETPFSGFTSPLALSLEYAEFRNLPSLNEAASAVDVLDNIQQLKGCSANKIYDVMNNRSNHFFLSELRNTYLDAKKSGSGNTAEKINACLRNAGIDHKIDQGKASELLQSRNWLSYLNAVTTDVCKNNRITYRNIPRAVLAQAHTFGSAKKATLEMKRIIDSRLDRPNPSPIGLAFCNSTLTSRNHVTMRNDGSVPINDQKQCPAGPHGGVIVGRRLALFADDSGRFLKDNYICQYLVRDSRGKSCESIADNKKLKPADKCINGSKWVEEDILLTNTSDVFYLEDRN